MAKAPYLVPKGHGLTLIRTAVETGSCNDAGRQGLRTAAMTANANGYLDRDRKQASIWYPTDKARRMISWLESQVAGGESLPIPANGSVSAIDTMENRLDRANALLASGDVMAARELAEALYDQAQAGGRFSARFKLKESLEACRRIQADALRIEVKTQMRIAEEWEKAKSEGRVPKGRPKSLPDENTFTAEEIGLTHKQLHYAKELLNAEKREPGIVERAIAARLAAGLEPSRANLRASIGTKTATKEERGNNLYETPAVAVHTLLALETFSPRIWEPACGKGAILRVLEEAGHEVLISDLVDYGTVTQDGECQEVADFLQTGYRDWPDEAREPDIITNPPYGEVMNAFIAHALKVHRPRKMALLLNIIFLAGTDDEDRIFARDENPPARIYIMTRRLPMMHRDGWEGPKSTSSMITMWAVWEMQPDGTYGRKGDTRTDFIDWKDYVPAELAEAESEAA